MWVGNEWVGNEWVEHVQHSTKQPLPRVDIVTQKLTFVSVETITMEELELDQGWDQEFAGYQLALILWA